MEKSQFSERIGWVKDRACFTWQLTAQATMCGDEGWQFVKLASVYYLHSRAVSTG